MALIIKGEAVEVPGLKVVSWLDDPRWRLRMGEDAHSVSDRWVRAVCQHTTKGYPDLEHHTPQHVKLGAGPPRAIDIVEGWRSNGRPGGAHVIVDADGVVYCLADLVYEVAYHAKAANAVTVGVESYQASDSGIYEATLDSLVLVTDAITWLLGVQRQIPVKFKGPLARLGGDDRGRDLVGVYGHRDVNDDRTAGDPGDEIMSRLALAGYERVDFVRGADKAVWVARQAELGVVTDGIPGPRTCKAAQGLWVHRPIDEQLRGYEIWR